MKTEDKIIKKITKMLGYCPVGTKDLLHTLAHPDLINLTQEYIKENINLDEKLKEQNNEKPN